MKLRRLFAAMSAAAVAVSAISVAAYAAIADTETVFDDSWSKSIQVAAGTITEACTIEINVKDVQAEGQISVKEMSGWTAIDLTGKFTTDGTSAEFDTQWGVLNISEDTTKVTIELSADDAATLNAAGVVFAGKNYTFVSADFAEEADVVVDAPAAATYDVDAILAIQENATWATYTSDVVNITGDGEYTFKIDGLSIDPSTVTVIYVKDKAAYDGGTEPSDIDPEVAMVASLKINGEELDVADGYKAMGDSGDILDCCLVNTWATNYVELPAGTIESVEFTLVIGDADEAPTDDVPVVDVPDDDTIVDDGSDDTIVDDGSDDTIVDDGDDTIIEDGADDAAPEADWSTYDADAMAALNADFVFGTTDQIDIYALVGDNWPNLAKIEGTFIWTDLEAGWCGGCGIGNGAVMTDGSSWLQGVEFGAANANAAVVGDGVATQTMIDITENPIATLATYDETTGETVFGRFFIQNWWNGVESGAQLAALTAYDAEGNVIGEIEYMEVPSADDTAGDDAANDDATGDTGAATDDGKGSADTGVEGVAAVAGVVALAGVAVVAARKRK